MNTPPVIVRELLVASRRRETWMLRLVFGIGIGLAFVFGVLFDSNRGPTALRALVIAGFVLGLLSGPYLTADAISREKREGTLGLLFLTPLSGLEIVLGKMVTHALQVSYALLATFPFLFLASRRNAATAPQIFVLWFVVCYLLNQLRIRRCRQAFRDGLRAFLRPPEREAAPLENPAVSAVP